MEDKIRKGKLKKIIRSPVEYLIQHDKKGFLKSVEICLEYTLSEAC